MTAYLLSALIFGLLAAVVVAEPYLLLAALCVAAFVAPLIPIVRWWRAASRPIRTAFLKETEHGDS